MLHRHKYLFGFVLAGLATSLGSIAMPEARKLSFEERVRAQERIERVRYSHQIGATRPFEVAVPRAVLEEKVRVYLKETVALESIWKTPVTSEMLSRELERMATGTRMPERLVELYAALGNDPFLIQECLARPALVGRLARNFFASDSSIHAEARTVAEALREDLASGRLDPSTSHSARKEILVVRTETDAQGRNRRPEPSINKDEPSRVELSPDEFTDYSGRLPKRVGEVGEVVENREGFVIQALLEMRADRLRVARYSVRKMTWEEWWRTAERGFDETSVAALPADGPAPVPQQERPQAPATSGCLPDTWVNGVLDGLPEPRSQHVSVWTGSQVLVWGGKGATGGYLNSGGRYDPATDTWSSISSINAPTVGFANSAIWTGSVLILWGGISGGTYFRTGGRYDPATDTWTATSTNNAPTARAYQETVWTGSVMIVWSGYDGVAFSNTGGRYDPASNVWTGTSTANAPPGRGIAASVWTGSRMVVWGGRDNFDNYYDGGGRYDPVANLWSPMSTANAPSARALPSAVWTGSRMIVWGGYDPLVYPDTGGRYDPGTDTWTPMSTTLAPVGRYDNTTVWTGGAMVVWGGANDLGPLGSGGRYNPANDSWSPTSTTNGPSPRLDHSAVWTGTLMVVWGGTDFAARFSTGGRYDPAADAWTPTSGGEAPSSRTGHTAVWTGNVMIVWGGYNEQALNTGGRYDPIEDTWVPTSSTGAPEARSDHTAIWTGNVMIVWGGTGLGYLNTGGRYDPTSNQWMATSIGNAPEGRAWHTAVWTGSRMIVWGGWGGSTPPYLNTGALYDPVFDLWTGIPVTPDTPAARYVHRAVWTGSLMLVWGGYNGQYLSTGGRFDLQTWRAMTMTNAPTPREGFSSVWAGGRMIVWGGSAGGPPVNTGGRYEPNTDTWTFTTLTNAPIARDAHAAVSTGNKMLVWGGEDGVHLLGTGSVYDPAADTWTPISSTNAPDARSVPTAVWTGNDMIVWGGFGGQPLSSGGRYAFDLDADGDGVRVCEGDCNDQNASIHPGAPEMCDGLDDDCDGTIPSTEIDADYDGFPVCAGDCNDYNAFTYPGAPEANDGEDNQCPGEPGYGLIDEIASNAGFNSGGSAAAFCWTPQRDAFIYQAVRSNRPDFASGCEVFSTSGTCWDDPTVPGPGQTFYYLVRAVFPYIGSWGLGAGGVERTVPCAP